MGIQHEHSISMRRKFKTFQNQPEARIVVFHNGLVYNICSYLDMSSMICCLYESWQFFNRVGICKLNKWCREPLCFMWLRIFCCNERGIYTRWMRCDFGDIFKDVISLTQWRHTGDTLVRKYWINFMGFHSGQPWTTTRWWCHFVIVTPTLGRFSF